MNRSKNDNYLYYRSNSKEWYQKTLMAHGVSDAVIIQSDAKEFNYSTLPPIAFCLFDVDLYNPTASVPPRLYDALIPGGIIVVDDCQAELSIYDGAGQAYREFRQKMNFKQELVFEKFGVIRKPLA